MIHNTLAIVIKKTDFRDYDRILTLYTREFGKIKALARSVRKPRAKLTSLSELFVISEFRLFLKEASAFGKITGGISLDSNSLIRYNMEKYHEACYICEVMDALTPLRQPNAEKFFLLKEKLQLLSQNILNQKEDFARKLLHITGFGVETGMSLEKVLQEHLAYPLKTRTDANTRE
ncbi:MAG: DNA repair protein RecO [Elusimicrobia bacterium]|nr:DNA repair protein RecO [Elusimicrobiota bacterium]